MNPDPKRILLLEDEKDLAELTAQILEGEGYSVTCIGEGYAGLKAASSGHFDLCLLNVVLPGPGGFSIAYKLQEREIELPLVFFTGTPWKEVKAKTEKLHTKMAYVGKPFSQRALIKKMAELLNGVGWLHRDA